MLNYVVIKYLEAASGSVLPTQLAKMTGISERTWRDKNKKISPKTQEKANKNARDSHIDSLRKAGMCEARIQEYIDQHPGFNKPGMHYSGLVYDCQVKGVMEFPQTISMAEEIDNMSSILFDARESDNFELFKESLLNIARSGTSIWIPDKKLEDILSSIEAATCWAELEPHMVELSVYVCLSLFARWDIEFCSQYFKPYKSRSLFALILPKLDPIFDNIKVGDVVAKRRDMFWLPVRRLISLLACMQEFVKNDRWPDDIPSIKEYSIAIGWPESNLKKWRNGTTKFTLVSFASIWNEYFNRNTIGKELCPPLPGPLFVAAIIWQIFFVEKTNGKTCGILINDDYPSYWEWHKNNLGSVLPSHETKEWPICFDKI